VAAQLSRDAEDLGGGNALLDETSMPTSAAILAAATLEP